MDEGGLGQGHGGVGGGEGAGVQEVREEAHVVRGAAVGGQEQGPGAEGGPQGRVGGGGVGAGHEGEGPQRRHEGRGVGLAEEGPAGVAEGVEGDVAQGPLRDQHEVGGLGVGDGGGGREEGEEGAEEGLVQGLEDREVLRVVGAGEGRLDVGPQGGRGAGGGVGLGPAQEGHEPGERVAFKLPT